jgi:outer membrane lipoprotein-sorting protein
MVLMMNRKGLIFLFVLLVGSLPTNARAQDAQALVREAFDYFRGKTSFSIVEMTIHRADWERRMTMKGWTKGLDKSLIIIAAPPKDEGNGTLKKGQEMWMYNPKVNRVIKIPPSMMAQSWMGSDFSNNDLAKSDTLIHDYNHSLTGSTTVDGKKVYLIESMPKPQAPVVWGMQRLKIREDYIFLEQVFYDEYLKPVKILSAQDIQMLGGKLFPKIMKMRKADEKEEYTVLEYQELTFGVDVQESLFTLSSLRTQRR